MNWLLDSVIYFTFILQILSKLCYFFELKTVILYTQLKEEMKKNDSIILTIQHNQFGLNQALSLKKQFFRSLANDAFEHCGRCINVLDLSGNLIQKIGKNHFENLPSLQLLNLNCNSIEKIDACSFEHLQSLQKLDLSSNKLTSITERLFLGLENLVELSLYNNRIKCVERNSFTRLKSLKSLNIGDNPIDGPNSTCPNFIKHQVVTQPMCFEKLAVLNLSLTNLKLVHGNMFICLKNLTTLFLNDNLIEKIENDSFICLSNLIFLDLSYNKIQMLTKRSFVGLFNLQELYLHKNFLKEIEPNSFDHLEKLKYLCIDLYRIEMTQDDLLNNLSRANVKVFDNPNYN
jgi:Leucine-rich repeat (LRR) protein